jgi:hypothetical protein
MGEFQLPKGTDGIDKLPETNTLLQNVFHSHDENNSIISRPGIPLISTPGGVCRGGFEWNEALYYVYSQQLRKITNTETGAFSVIGTIAGDDLIFSAVGAVTIAIIARGSASYTLDKSDTLVDTSNNTNFVPFVSVTSINGRAIYVPEDGQKVLFSDVGAFGTIGALSFFTPEQRPDDTKFCFTLDNYLYLAGTQSIERYKNVTTSQIFARVGSAFDFGFIGGFLEVDEAVVFVGRKRNQSPGIFALDANKVVKISNPRIDKIIRNYTTLELSETISGRINWFGFDLATLTLRRDSILFFGGDWSLLDTVIDNVSQPWTAGFIVEFDNKYYSGFEDKLGFFDDVNFDYGDRITRIIETSLSQENREYMSGSRLELGISQGFNSGEKQSVGLQTTEDGVLYGPIIYEDLALIGNYGAKLVWEPPGGLGTYQGFMGIRLITRENVIFNADHLIIKGRV